MITPPPLEALRPLNDNRQTPRGDSARAPALESEATNSALAETPHFLDDLVMGLRFYSRLPTGERPHRAPDLSRIALALPFTSVLVGLPPALLLVLCVWLGVPPLLGASLAVGLAVLLTGAMAEDGLADAADALPQPGGLRRLEVMKDPRHGTYGVVALVLLLLIRVSALGAAAVPNPIEAGAIWLAATVVARSGSLWLTLRLPPARMDGVSAASGRVSRTAFCAGTGFALAFAFVFAAPASGIVGLVLSLIAAAGVAIGWTALCRRLVGGQTGDLIGALQALIEIAMLSVLVMLA